MEPTSRVLTFSEQLLSGFLRVLPIKHGKHRLLDRLAPAAWCDTSQPVEFEVGQVSCLVDVDDLVGWHMAMLASFDPEVIEVLSSAASERDVLWDIGANKCACSLFMANRVAGLSVVAIEPQSTLAPLNQLNLDRVCGGRYEYQPVALGEESGELRLVIPQGNRGAASFHMQVQAGQGDVEEVCRVLTAPQLLAASQFSAPTLVKIDVEGHEWSVIRSLKTFFASGQLKMVVFENNPGHDDDFANIHRAVTEDGYRVFGIQRTVWRTSLVEAGRHVAGANDYAIIRPDIVVALAQQGRLLTQ